jgi:hypothetical protein
MTRKEALQITSRRREKTGKRGVCNRRQRQENGGEYHQRTHTGGKCG